MFSPTRIAEHLGITIPEAKQVRAILETRLVRGERHELEVTTPNYILEHSSASRKLYMIDTLSLKWSAGRFHGVESIPSADDTYHTFRGIEYLNTGDSYGATLMYDFGKGKWVLSSWGDVVERQSRRFSE